MPDDQESRISRLPLSNPYKIVKAFKFLGLLFGLVSVCSAYDARVRHVVQQIRAMNEIGGEAIGYAGIPGDFYLLYRYCLSAATDKDMQDMITDESPAVRIMGAKCILNSPYRKIDLKLVDRLLGDQQKIVVGPGGCSFFEMKVSDVVAELKKDAHFLGK